MHRPPTLNPALLRQLVIVILFSVVPFRVPLPMTFLGIITSALQAVIFVRLTMTYRQSGGRRGSHGQ